MSQLLRMSPPWVTYVNKLKALFGEDPSIDFKVNWEGENPTVALITKDGDKATALTQLLPTTKEFGNVTLKIIVDGPFSNRVFISGREIFEVVFKNNPVLSYCIAPAPADYWFIGFTFIVFKNRVVQFFNDNLNHPHGMVSTLYEVIAEEVFKDAIFDISGVAFCTDIEHRIKMPFGEWPW